MKVSQKALWAAGIAVTAFLAICAFDCAFAQEAKASVDASVTRWAFLAAAISTGLSALAAGIAVAYVGAAAVGAVSEKPEMAGRALIFVGLAEGIAIYGLIIAIMILGKV
ncbi:MAG TPA: ATP synthase subunit C [Candidatus Omnitrophota bacterium]|nr:ATP synthase subunit C [Candidatus Omnitrophota bacterium]HQJ14970.1 ATP synthase subunit C [Candidatus Omnitrophota bacterium]